ncbi:hypothetical protein C8F01DRAFT_1350927 [Mycena amicta]|nr:hypothetical protein C8F01DRAFT_1350927 [Mycena amicta]
MFDFSSVFFTVNREDPTNVDVDSEARLGFWNRHRDFLHNRGFTLYEVLNFELHAKLANCHPSQPQSCGGTLPYAVWDHLSIQAERKSFLFIASIRGVAMYASDNQNRNVVLKLIRDGSHEHNILKRIISFEAKRPDGIIPGIVPVLDLFPLEGHWAVVMPRYLDRGSHRGWLCSVKELLFFVEQVLDGLVFLHSQRIVHRDLAPHNLLANYVLPNTDYADPRMQMSHSTRYGWIDRSSSLRHVTFFVPLPLEGFNLWRLGHRHTTRCSSRRISVQPVRLRCRDGGTIFLCLFPAPDPGHPSARFLDKMVTRNVASQFTAQGALDFVHHIQDSMTEEELRLPCCPPGFDAEDVETYDRWQGLPAVFVKEWGHMPSRWECRYGREPCASSPGIIGVSMLCELCGGR